MKNQTRLAGHGISGPDLVCIDLQPGTTTQAPERADILNVCGFSDAVLSVVAMSLVDDSRSPAEAQKVTP